MKPLTSAFIAFIAIFDRGDATGAEKWVFEKVQTKKGTDFWAKKWTDYFEPTDTPLPGAERFYGKIYVVREKPSTDEEKQTHEVKPELVLKEGLASFEEAFILDFLNQHPPTKEYVIKLHDYTGGWLVMDMLTSTLDKYYFEKYPTFDDKCTPVRRERDELQTWRHLLQILKGINELYESGVTWGDLSAFNIGLDGNNDVKFIDFGECSTTQDAFGLGKQLRAFQRFVKQLFPDAIPGVFSAFRRDIVLGTIDTQSVLKGKISELESLIEQERIS